ncbi:MAG: histidine phosphatase family protein [Lysinibacillus sp.]
MSKVLYVVRHAKAEGQEPIAQLTAEGQIQAVQLKTELQELGIERIISSPFLRAIQTVHPFANDEGLDIELDDRLAERMLSTIHMDDWLEKLAQTFDEPDLRFEGGESSREALVRISSVMQDVLKSDETTLLVSHGNLISLLLQSLDSQFGFEEWKAMKNPHIFRIDYEEGRVTFFDFEYPVQLSQ